MATTTIRLTLQDVLGNPLDDHAVLCDIFDLHNINHYQVNIPIDGHTDVAIKLQNAPGGVYRFELSPTNYRVVQFFLTLPPGGTTSRKEPVVFPVDADRVVDISAPSFGDLNPKLQLLLKSSSISPDGSRPATSGQPLYDALPPKLKAALLNLFVKSSNTMLGSRESCFDYICGHNIVKLDQDRVFAKIDAALAEESAVSKDFRSADFSLHREIPPYKCFASFKTLNSVGNLQLTFLRNGATGNDYLVDMDIDEAQGIVHAFEVIKNTFTGLTNPYDVREILTVAQGLKPLYSFRFAQLRVASIATPPKQPKVARPRR